MMVSVFMWWNGLSGPLRYYLRYTVAFIVVGMLVFLPFVMDGKGFVWADDGLYQHLNAFMYLGEWVRGAIGSLLSGDPELPIYEFSIGYGGDVLTTLSYYGFGDPFALISIFFSREHAEAGYAISILLRFYFVGIAFSVFARKMKCGDLASLCGSLAYAFSCFALFAGVRHPFFLDPMIWMPLIFFGLEKILAHENPIPYIIFIFMMTISSFYFLYMVLILAFLYGMCRLLLPSRRGSARRTVKVVAASVLCSALGVGLGCMVFLPTAMAFLSNVRVSDAYRFSALYPVDYYRSFLGCLVTSNEPGTWTRIGMAPLCWLGVIAFLMKRNVAERSFKAYFVLLLLMFLVPFVGHVMNGMGYVTNRWTFAWSFWAAFLFAKGSPLLSGMSRRERIGLSVVCLAFVLFAVLGSIGISAKQTLIGCSLLLVCLVLVWGIPHLDALRVGMSTPAKERLVRCGFFCATIVSICWIAYALFGGYTSQFAKAGTAVDQLDGDLPNYSQQFDDEEFFRLDRDAAVPSLYDLPLDSAVSATTFYWSLVDPSIVEFLNENSAFSSRDYVVGGIASRSYLVPLVSGRYFLTIPGDASIIPYSFEKVYEDGVNELFESQYSLPFGYSYESVFPMKELEALSFAQRQEAMLQGAFVDEELIVEGEHLGEDPLELTSRELDFAIGSSESVALADDGIIAEAPNATIDLVFDCPPGCELYVQLLGLEYAGSSTRPVITASCDSRSAQVVHFTPYDIYAKGRENYLINLGYSDEQRTSLTLAFDSPGEYAFEGLAVVCQPMAGFEERIEALREDTLEDVEFDTNRISGRISLDRSKLLCLSLPYSQGWSATVDGQPAETLRTNTMFTGIALSPGEHEIVLRYETPWIEVGLGTSVASLLIVIIIGARSRRKRNHSKKPSF